MDNSKKVNMTREEYRNQKNNLNNIDDKKEEINETKTKIENIIEEKSSKESNKFINDHSYKFDEDEDEDNDNNMANILDDEEFPKRKKRLRPWAFWLFLIIFSSLLIFSALSIYNWLKDNKNIKNLNDEISSKVKPEKINIEGKLINPPEGNKESDYWYYVKLPFYSVDFAELKKKNSDTVAFIHMDQTNINYPVVQTTNNEYYLTRAFDKSKNYAGWVYMDYRNSSTNLSDNTVIYGHGRLDKTVFGSLKNALTKEWQQKKDNYAIWLSTPKKNMLFQIFSIYTIKSESYYIETSFKSEDEKQKWINTMLERDTANIKTPVQVSDKILTLSTCLNSNGDRIVVQSKLVKVQNRTKD